MCAVTGQMVGDRRSPGATTLGVETIHLFPPTITLQSWRQVPYIALDRGQCTSWQVLYIQMVPILGFALPEANFLVALIWTSNDIHQTCPLLTRSLFPCSHKQFLSGASFRANRLMPLDLQQVLRLKCPVTFTVHRNHFQ